MKKIYVIRSFAVILIAFILWITFSSPQSSSDYYARLTAYSSWLLVIVTIWILFEQSMYSRENIKITLFNNLEDTFFNKYVPDRRTLAQRRLSLSKDKNQIIQNTLMDFFESLGMYLRRGYIDLDLVWEHFCYYTIRWWGATQNIIFNWREEEKDKTLYANFQYLNDKLCKYEMKKRHMRQEEIINDDIINQFLEEESNLESYKK
jgi:hypothetical protein